MDRRDVPDLSVLVVNWRGGEVFRRCVAAIRESCRGVDHEIVVVDNASPAGELDEIERVPGLRLIRNRRNLGFARATNLSVAAARGRWLLLLNNDVILAPDCVERLLEAGSGTDVAVPRLVLTDGRTQRSVTGLPRPADVLYACFGFDRLSRRFDGWMLRRFDYASRQRVVAQPAFSAVLIRREVWESVGALDEEFPLLWNDTDWFHRFHEGGWRCEYVPDAVAVHFHGMSVNRRRFRKILESSRGMLRYFRKHRPEQRWGARLAVMLSFVLRILREAALVAGGR